MTTLFVQDGTTINYTTTTAITAGTLLIIGSLPAVALESKAAGSGTIACGTEGVFTLTKKAAASTNWAQGGRVGYIVTGGVNKLTGVLTSGKIIGTGWALATTTASTGTVKLFGMASPTAGL
jgi:predicted RecA/RadA family phage recombinase